MTQRLLLSAFALFLLAAGPAQAQLFGPSDEEIAQKWAEWEARYT